ncbi:leucine efflux protein [Nucisporomicrobium flavum]|uniref:leucine efflux protein n=1 Tax=Nucisporomicrobium flavum TaxID=2785915 RepID=UPI003C30B33E
MILPWRPIASKPLPPQDGAVLGITDFWTYVLGTVAIVLLPGPNSIFVLSVAAQRGVRAGYRAAGGVFLGDAVLMVLAAAGVASLLRTYPPVFMVVKYAGGAYLAWVGFGIIRGAWRKWRERSAAISDESGAGPASDGDAAAWHADSAPDAGAKGAGAGATDAGAGATDAGAGATDAGATGAGATGAGATGAGAGARGAGAGARGAGAGAGKRGVGEGKVGVGMRRPFRRALVVSLLNPKAILFVVSFFIQFVDPGYAHPAVSFLILGAILQVFSFLYLSGLIFGGQFLAGQFRRRRRLSAMAATGIGAVFVGFGVKLATATAG